MFGTVSLSINILFKPQEHCHKKAGDGSCN